MEVFSRKPIVQQQRFSAFLRREICFDQAQHGSGKQLLNSPHSPEHEHSNSRFRGRHLQTMVKAQSNGNRASLEGAPLNVHIAVLSTSANRAAWFQRGKGSDSIASATLEFSHRCISFPLPTLVQSVPPERPNQTPERHASKQVRKTRPDTAACVRRSCRCPSLTGRHCDQNSWCGEVMCVRLSVYSLPTPSTLSSLAASHIAGGNLQHYQRFSNREGLTTSCCCLLVKTLAVRTRATSSIRL